MARSSDGWNGFSVLHTAAARVGALDLGFTPGQGGLDAGGDGQGRRARLLFNLGADEIDDRAGRLRRLYRHAWRPGRASRRRHPAGRRLYGKIRPLREHGRPRAGWRLRAAFPPGDAREDWAILRALSGALGAPLPFDSLAQLRAQLVEAHPHLAQARRRSSRPTRRATRGGGAAAGDGVGRTTFVAADRRFLSHQSDRPRLGHHGRMFGAGAGPAAAARRNRSMKT